MSITRTQVNLRPDEGLGLKGGEDLGPVIDMIPFGIRYNISHKEVVFVMGTKGMSSVGL